MRVIKGLIHKNEYTLCHPFRALISGSSGKRILKHYLFLWIYVDIKNPYQLWKNTVRRKSYKA